MHNVYRDIKIPTAVIMMSASSLIVENIYCPNAQHFAAHQKKNGSIM
jgi:hypothetical protein